MRRGWSSRVAESAVVFLPTRPPKRCQLSFALGGLTLACLSLSAVCRLAQGRAVGSPDGVAASGGDAVTSRRPPTGGCLSEPGRCPTGDLVWSFESGRLGHTRGSRWPRYVLAVWMCWRTFPRQQVPGPRWTAGREPRPCQLPAVGTSAAPEPGHASVSFSVSGTSNRIVIIKKTVKTKRVSTCL